MAVTEDTQLDYYFKKMGNIPLKVIILFNKFSVLSKTILYH